MVGTDPAACYHVPSRFLLATSDADMKWRDGKVESTYASLGYGGGISDELLCKGGRCGYVSAPTTAVPSPELRPSPSPSLSPPSTAWSDSGDFYLPDAQSSDADGEAVFALVGLDEIETVLGDSSQEAAPTLPGQALMAQSPWPLLSPATTDLSIPALPAFSQLPPAMTPPSGSAPDATHAAVVLAAAALAAVANQGGSFRSESAVPFQNFPGWQCFWGAAQTLPGHAATGDVAAAAAPKPTGAGAEPLRLEPSPEGLMLIPASGWPEDFVAEAEKKELAASKAKTRFEGGRRPTRGRSRSPTLFVDTQDVERTQRGREPIIQAE